MRCPSKLNVAVLNLPPLFAIGEDPAHSGGFEGRFLHVIFSMLGWDYNLLVPKDPEWGRKAQNGNWTGLIGMILRGEADVALGRIAMTESRMEVTDFSMAYSIEEGSFVTEKPQEERLPFAYLYPFDLRIWTCLLSVLILMSVLFPVLLQERFSFGQVFFYLYATILRQPPTLQMDNGNKGKFLVFFWMVFAMVMSTTYSAKLFTLMAMPFPRTIIRNFRELSKAVQSGTYKCYTAKGTSTVQLLLTSKEEHLQALGKAIDVNGWYATSSELESGVYVNQNSAQQLSRTRLQLFFGQSKYVISRDSLGSYPIGIALRKNFRCKSKLDKALSRFMSTGMYEKFLRDESVKISLTVNEHFPLKNVDKKVHLEDMLGVLMLYGIGMALSLIALLGEIIIFHFND